MRLSYNVLKRYFPIKTSSKILYHCFFHFFSDIKNKKWNSHGGHTIMMTLSQQNFPFNGVHKSAKGKASFIGVADVH